MKFKQPRSKLVRECRHLHLLVLRLKRGDHCEFHTGACCDYTHRFHILGVGSHPRLEFVDLNVLLSCWLPKGSGIGHAHWHSDYHKAKIIEEQIIRLRGIDYKDKLLIIEKGMQRHNSFYLEMRLHSLRQELERLRHE